MDGKILLRSLSLKNILSFGPEGVDIALQPLNVLIGPNGSGKSNFLEAIRLLQSTPRDIAQPIRENGGISEWLWKGNDTDVPLARLASVIQASGYPTPSISDRIIHSLSFDNQYNRLHIANETVRSLYGVQRFFAYSYDGEIPYIWTLEEVKLDEEGKQIRTQKKRKASQLSFKSNLSILFQRNDPETYPDITTLSELYSRIVLYTNFSFGRLAAARLPQSADLESAFLNEDYSNLALVLNDLQNRPGVIDTIIKKLRLFNDRIEDIKTLVNSGMVELRIREKGLAQTIPATRLSDGTLRFLCLLAILCHPNPPPLICIEEPELGMHPDILATIAELLVEASKRTQLIITTHSDILLSKFRDTPEALVICERNTNGTTMRRLTASEIEGWPDEISLGDIWLKGAIGGVRW